MKKLTGVFLFLFCSNCFAYTIQDAIRVCVGEAAGEPFKGKVAVMEVLRRRGSLKGFYGYQAKHIAKEPQETFQECLMAFEKSKFTNYTKGATLFDSTDFKIPSFAKFSQQVTTIGKHVFYKEV